MTERSTGVADQCSLSTEQSSVLAQASNFGDSRPSDFRGRRARVRLVASLLDFLLCRRTPRAGSVRLVWRVYLEFAMRTPVA